MLLNSMENTLKMEYLITQIQQQNRAKSCLESYHNHFQQKIPFKPNWHELLEGLRREEYSISHEQAEKERKGKFFTGSSNFSKRFMPEWEENKFSQKFLLLIPIILLWRIELVAHFRRLIS